MVLGLCDLEAKTLTVNYKRSGARVGGCQSFSAAPDLM